MPARSSSPQRAVALRSLASLQMGRGGRLHCGSARLRALRCWRLAAWYFFAGRQPGVPASTADIETVVVAAAYVGSQSCAQCHAAEAKAWQASQHAVAMQHATGRTVLGNFNDATYSFQGVQSELLPARRQVLHSHGRTRRPARGLRGQVHVRRRAAAAIPRRVTRWPPAGRLGDLGCASARRGWPALVPPVPRPSSSITPTSCTGRVGRRTGTSCARTATRPR